MVGRGITNLYGKASETRVIGEEVLKVEGLSSEFVHDISFSLRKGEILHRHELDFYSIDLVMNLYDREELLRRLHALLNRDALRVMIHEQYFYSDYHAYQPDFEEKLDHAFGLLCKNGYESCFAEEF